MDDVREHAKYYGITEQAEGETDAEFRGRVAGVLRDQGHIIEAHEIFTGRRYDAEDGQDVVTGIMGALAQAMQGVDYHSTGERRLGDDFAAGTLIQNPKPEMSAEMALLAVMLLGK